MRITATLVLLTIALAQSVYARTIHVEFSYSGTADGYRLYQNNTQVCEITDGNARSMDCNITINHKDIYTLTAYTGSTETPKSLPFVIFRARALYHRLRGGVISGGSM